MRTTIDLNDKIYAALVQQSIQLYGSTRNLSKVVNDYLEKALSRKEEKQAKKMKNMFGIFKDAPVGTDDLREKTDRMDKW